MLHDLSDFVERAHFDLYFQVQSLGFLIGGAAVERGCDAAGEVHVVVFEQYHVEKADAVVSSAADFHGFFFEHAHAGGGFTRIEHTGLSAFEALHVFGGHSRNAAHALHDVEHQTFGLQERAHFARHDHRHIAGLHVVAVVHKCLHLHLRVETVEHFPRDAQAGKDALFLDKQFRLAHCLFGNAAKGGVVAVAYVLRKSKVNQAVIKFVYCVHIYNIECYLPQNYT